jgi:nicotinamide phosphoribosyltransferase
LRAAKRFGYSASNIAFGMGGALLQKLDRDTQRFAYKCSSVTVNDVERDVFKDPVTDPGKKSKAGRLDLLLDDDTYKTVRLDDGEIAAPDSQLVTVFENGKILKEYDLESVRARAVMA